MTEEKTVGGKPLEEYRDRVEAANARWHNYCVTINKFNEGKVPIGCIIRERGHLTMGEYLSKPRRYAGGEDEEPKV